MKEYFLPTRISVLLLLFIVVHSCNGQVKTGLPNNSAAVQPSLTDGKPILTKTQGSDQYQNIHCSLVDKAGNIWFGTTGEGVYRFDGKSFIQFTIKDGLSNNSVWCILEDRLGRIWFGTSGGICRYDGKNIVPVTINRNFLTAPVANQYYSDWSTQITVWSMLQDRTGKIWFGTGDGVYWYDGKSFTRFLQNDSVINKEGLQLKMVDCMLEDKNGNIWFGSGMPPGEEGLCRYDGKAITRFKPGGDGWIRYLLQDKNGTIWSGGRHEGVWRYDGTVFKKFTVKEGIGLPVFEDKAGNIWFNGEEKLNSIESSNGIWRYDGTTFTNFNMKETSRNYYAFCIVEDGNGNIWVGTRNTGLFRFDGKTFTLFSE